MDEEHKTVLVVDDIAANRNVLRDALEPAGYEILMATDGEVGLNLAKEERPDLILQDIMMPGMNGFEVCRRLKADEATKSIPVIFITAKDETASVVEGFRVGGSDYITKPFRTEEVLVRVETHLKVHRLTEALKSKNADLEDQIRRREEAEQEVSSLTRREADRWGIDTLVGESQAMASIKQAIRKVHAFPTTNVLITGESGTGKELIARAIHFGSPLAKRPFIPVNCSAVPAELAESSFFGHVKGAFTGASSDREGYFAQADGGTLFLDEIGDMPLPLQVKLLRVLEDGVIVPVGGVKESRISVRIVAGTNADLRGEIDAKKFRQDLYFRLAGYLIDAPPLRERPKDIPLLAEHFLNQFAEQMGMLRPSFTDAARLQLLEFDFPGNVRELRNIIERALIESGGGTIEDHHLRFVTALPSVENPPPPASQPAANTKRPFRFPVDSEEARVLNYIRQNGAINNAECRELLSVGLQRACYLLRKLHRLALVKRMNSGKAVEYISTELSVDADDQLTPLDENTS